MTTQIDVTMILDELTLEEKADLLSGSDHWHTTAVDRLGVPSIMMSDGPHGLRVQRDASDIVGVHGSEPSTCFPTASALAASWDRELVRRVGEAIGAEAQAMGISFVLGPAVNIKRSPLGGRNFEYFSEDPFLAGELGLAWVEGVQSKGVGTSVKHFAANNQERWRMVVNAEVDQRALREIYLPAFEKVIRRGTPWTVMCAYNRLNGTYCSEHEWLLTSLLRNEWGFAGVLVTDWGACNDRATGVSAGQDLEMPYSGGMNTRAIIRAVRDGTLDEDLVNRSVRRNLELVNRALADRVAAASYDPDEHHALAKEAAIRSMVLLKNDAAAGGSPALPLPQEGPVAFLGAFADAPRIQGGGSSHVNPHRVETALEAARTLLGNKTGVSYAPGYDLRSAEVDEQMIDEARTLAAKAKRAVVFMGLTEVFESEGFDREHLRVPANHIALLEAVCEVQSDVVVVLSNGAPIEMPWVDKPAAILESYLAGGASGAAVADLLFGLAPPSGKLAETFPQSLNQNPSFLNFPGTRKQVEYREGIFVGYRYYDSAGIEPLFPFGHGLSYTTFEYGPLRLSKKKIKDTDVLKASVRVTNPGPRAGREIVQLYVGDTEATVVRPEKELKGFAVLDLAPGQTDTAFFELDKSAFAFWDEQQDRFVVEPGEFVLLAGSSSRDIRSTAEVEVSTKAPVKKVYGMNSTIEELAETTVGALLYKRLMKEWESEQKDAGNKADDAEREMVTSMMREMPLRSAVMLSEGRLPLETAELILDVINGKKSKLALTQLLGGLPGAGVQEGR